MEFVVEVSLHHHSAPLEQSVYIVSLINSSHEESMGPLFAHFSHPAGTRGELVLHGADLHLLIERSLSHQVLLVYLAHWLGSQQSGDLRLTLPLPTVNVEIFSLYFMVLI